MGPAKGCFVGRCVDTTETENLAIVAIRRERDDLADQAKFFAGKWTVRKPCSSRDLRHSGAIAAQPKWQRREQKRGWWLSITIKSAPSIEL
jgi:hypothetical protein